MRKGFHNDNILLPVKAMAIFCSPGVSTLCANYGSLFLYFYPTLFFSPTPPTDMKNIAKVFGDKSKEFIKMALCQGTQNNRPLKT